MCGPRKHNCQPFCGPEGRFDCSDSVCSLRPAPFSYLCVRVRILCVLKTVCCCRIKPVCRRTPAVVSIFTDSAAWVTVFLRTTAPLHYYDTHARKQAVSKPVFSTSTAAPFVRLFKSLHINLGQTQVINSQISA